MTEKPEHKQGCDALGGYGQGVVPCSCGAAGLSVVPELPEVAWQDGDFVQSERPVDLCSGDASAWIPLTPHAPAQAIIERLEAKLKEQALQYLSDNGQWIEETDRLRAELSALKAKQVADIDEVMELVEDLVDDELKRYRGMKHSNGAAREALRAQLTKDRT